MYGPWIALPVLEPGMHTIRVTLNTNDYRDYTWNGLQVEASTEVHVEADAAMSDMTMASHSGHSGEKIAPVIGLQDTLQVEVTYVPSEASRTMSLRTVYDDPGHYVADLIPTSPGHYRFRFFGDYRGKLPLTRRLIPWRVAVASTMCRQPPSYTSRRQSRPPARSKVRSEEPRPRLSRRRLRR